VNLLTKFGDRLGQREEGERDQQVESPVAEGGEGDAGATG